VPREVASEVRDQVASISFSAEDEAGLAASKDR
jgi:hypothetical protein